MGLDSTSQGLNVLCAILGSDLELLICSNKVASAANALSVF